MYSHLVELLWLMSLSKASLRCENLHWDFGGDVHHVVEVEVDAH